MTTEEFNNLVYNLPEGINKDNLREYFIKFNTLDYSEDSLTTMFDSLNELANKQWHTYSLLDKSTSAKIKQWLKKNINFSSYDICEYELIICSYLGFNDIYTMILNSQEVKNNFPLLIKEVLDDFGDSVENPYKDYNKSNNGSY